MWLFCDHGVTLLWPTETNMWWDVIRLSYTACMRLSSRMYVCIIKIWISASPKSSIMLPGSVLCLVLFDPALPQPDVFQGFAPPAWLVGLLVTISSLFHIYQGLQDCCDCFVSILAGNFMWSWKHRSKIWTHGISTLKTYLLLQKSLIKHSETTYLF